MKKVEIEVNDGEFTLVLEENLLANAEDIQNFITTHKLYEKVYRRDPSCLVFQAECWGISAYLIKKYREVEINNGEFILILGEGRESEEKISAFLKLCSIDKKIYLKDPQTLLDLAEKNGIKAKIERSQKK